jgi:hypothetical protein
MSLQLAAQHLSTKGRGPDDTLVHMSRNEVKSLNDLAMAHGGQLTINPETGLPEAGFLSAILPMIAGAALGPAGFGLASSAMGAGLMVGAGSYLLNPKAGLMGALSAGMGAYGGAGLGEALAQSGMQQATAEQLAKTQAGLSGIVDASTVVDPNNPALRTLAPGISPDQYAKNVLAQTQPYVDARTAAQTAFDAGSFTDRLGTVGQGAKTLASPGGFSNLYTNLGGGFGTAKTALAAAAPAMSLQPKDTSVAPVVDKDRGQQYSYSAGAAQPLPSPDVPTYEDMLTKQDNFGKQQNYYPNQGYTPISNDQAKQMYHYAADGGLMGYAGGGPVEQMSSNAMMGVNTMYPMANIAPFGGGAINMMSGGQGMAGGGVSYDPKTQRYTGGIADAAKPENRDVNIYNDQPTATSSGGTPPGPNSGTPAEHAQAVANVNAIASALSSMGIMGIVANALGLSGPNANSISDAAPGMGGAGGDGIGGGTAPDGSAGGAPGDSPGDSSGGGDSGTASAAHGGLSPRFNYHMATGGISDAGYNLGGYSDGGRLLRGPGDGVSDSIPAMIGKRQPARLADGEFVVPARIVSEIGNGSTEAGARKLYAMMDRVQAARRQTVGKGKVAKNSRADKYLPA